MQSTNEIKLNQLTMEPEIDADVTLAVEVGRGQGLDWERSLTLDNMKKILCHR